MYVILLTSKTQLNNRKPIMKKISYLEAVKMGFTMAYNVGYGVGNWDMLVKPDADLDGSVEVYCVVTETVSFVSGWLADWEFDGAVVVTDTI
jgi:hypothetical protein